jgi:hypothetical protein
MNIITKSEKSQEQFSDDLYEFITKWNSLSYDEHRIENELTGDAYQFAKEIRAKTCPEWCSKVLHAEIADFWDSIKTTRRLLMIASL